MPRFVSIIIPVLNEEGHLGAQLAALAQQSYRGSWEVLVVDNGSTDRSCEIALEWTPRLPGLRVLDARDRRGLNHARNVGALEAKGDFLAFCDGDDVVSPGWLEAMVEAAPSGDIFAGTLEASRLNPPLVRSWRRGGDDKALVLYHDFMPAAPGGNLGVWTDVARDVGWDEDFEFGSSDIEFSWRAQLRAYRIVHVPGALIHIRFRTDMLGSARQWFRYGQSGALLYNRFRSLGLTRPSSKAAAREWAWLGRHCLDLLDNPESRGWWLRTAGFRLGRLVGSLRHRAYFP